MTRRRIDNWCSESATGDGMRGGAKAPRAFQVRQLNHPANAGLTALQDQTRTPGPTVSLGKSTAKPFDCRYLASWAQCSKPGGACQTRSSYGMYRLGFCGSDAL